MYREFFRSSDPWRRTIAWAGAVFILGSTAVNAAVTAAVNTWYGDFYSLAQDAVEVTLLAQRDLNATGAYSVAAVAARDGGLDRMWALLWRFLIIVMPVTVLNPVVTFVGSHYAFTWRMCLMESYTERWGRRRGGAMEGASQRIHEDTQRFASSLQSGMLRWLQSMLILAVFVPRLLELGGALPQPAYILPSHPTKAWLLLVAIAVAVIGFGVAILVARPLVRLEVNNQKVEAELRKKLVHAEGGEELAGNGAPAAPTGPSAKAAVPWPQQGASVNGAATDGGDDAGGVLVVGSSAYREVFSALRVNYSALYAKFFSFNLWTASWKQGLAILPFMVAGPQLFALDNPISMGVLVQVSDAFTNTFEHLAVGMDNWTAVNEFRSVLVRLSEFESVLDEADGGRTEGRAVDMV